MCALGSFSECPERGTQLTAFLPEPNAPTIELERLIERILQPVSATSFPLHHGRSVQDDGDFWVGLAFSARRPSDFLRGGPLEAWIP
jgi:hypothetical protein